jgi:peptide methionine sulfoxide reductase msrA/msrB
MILRLILVATALAGVALVVLLDGTEAADGPDASGRPAPPAGGKVVLPDAAWRALLSAEQHQVLRRGGTECAFTGAYGLRHEPGVYRCVGCGLILFDAADKFDSGTGWPSFLRGAAPGALTELRDASHGMVRTEIRCARCDGHLGHVFEDGPPPTGLRYCMNSAALEFESADTLTAHRAANAAAPRGLARAMFAAGCFWGVEHAFRQIPGVVDVAVGYSGGWKESPTYRQVCTDLTGHAEVVLVTFDPAAVSYERLLEVFWQIHDPTQRDRQGPDIGRQYRSALFAFSDEQRRAAETSRDRTAKQLGTSARIATEIIPASEFWRAEEYHQRYHEKHGVEGCAIR